MQQNAGLFSQHVSSIIMPIFSSTLVSTALWCLNLENVNSEVWSTKKSTHINYKQQNTTAFHHITNTIHTAPSNHYNTQITPVDQTSLFIFSKFGHQKAVLTNVLLKMGIIMRETC
jgi:archaellum component FlaF (FlaF/FlaG flagellin family)